jgi:hypothetical protein
MKSSEAKAVREFDIKRLARSGPYVALTVLLSIALPWQVWPVDLVVDGVALTLASNTMVDGEVVVQNGGVLTLNGMTLTLVLDFDEEHHIDISDNSSLVVNNSIITSQGGQYWFELSNGSGPDTPTLEVNGNSLLTRHSGIRPFDQARVIVTGGDVEELQVRDQVSVSLSNAATYAVLFFEGVTASLSDLDTGSGINNTISVAGGWSFQFTNAEVYGYQIDLLDGAVVNLAGGDGIVASFHTPGDLGDELMIVEGVTSQTRSSGSVTNLGSSFTFTDANVALINTYIFGRDRVWLRDIHVNEVNAEQFSELVIGDDGVTTLLNCNLCQTYDRALMNVYNDTICTVEIDPEACDNLASATASYADFDAIGQGVMRFANMDLQDLDITAREAGRLELHNSIIDPGRLLNIDPLSASIEQAEINASFTASRLSGSPPLSVDFFDLSAGSNINTHVWQFGDGSSSTESEPTHVYVNEGHFDVSLAVTTDNGQHADTRERYIFLGLFANGFE